ncbi:DUF6221 family protein [Streptomyces cyaneofuscatus]|uniref:DUF6221 family protein n=1 Tax=Streptomyces cyaneofuscatus TaxID=66883 RepID=UPI0036DB3D51
MTDALVAFLRARLDDDERVARAATEGPWRVDSEDFAEAIYDARNQVVVGGGRWGGEASVFDTTEDAIHIARQDPARTLREVEAARAVLDLHEEAGHRMDRAMRDADTVAYQEARTEQRALRKVLLHEAAVHEAHLDYLEEWRP